MTRTGISRLASLRARLSLIIFLSLIPAALFLVYDAFTIRQRVHTEAQDELLRLGQFVADSYTSSLENVQRLLAVIALDAEVESAAQGGDRTACTSRLAELTDHTPGTIGFGLWELDGNLICAHQVYTTTINVSDRLWFQQALHTGEFAIGNFQFSRPSHLPTLAFGYPVRDQNGALQAILATGWNLAVLNYAADWSNFPDDAIITVFDAEGTVLARNHDFEAWVGLRRPGELLQSVHAPGAGVIRAMGVDGVERLYAFMPVTGPGGTQVWLSIGRTPQVVYAGVTEDIARDLLGVGAILLVALAALWWGSERLLLRRIARLVGASERLATGDWGVRTPVDVNRDELDQLALTFNNMAGTLQQRQAELLARERFLQLALESTRMVAWTWDPAQHHLQASDNFVDLYGISADEYAKLEFTRVHPDDRNVYERLVMHAVQERTPYHTEFRIIRPDNEQTLWLEERAVPVVDDAGQLQAFAGVAIDITTRKKAEAQLETANYRYRVAEEAAKGFTYEWNLETGIVTRSESIERVTGYKVEELEKTWQAWFDLIHPDDLMVHSEAEAVEFINGLQQESFGNEYRIRHKAGHYVWVLEQSLTIRAETGKVRRVIGLTVNVTERKLTETRLARLQTVTAALSEALQSAQVAEVMVNQGAAALGAVSSSVLLLTEDGQTLKLARTSFSKPVVQSYQQFPLSLRVPASDAIRSGQPVWIESQQQYRERYPHLAEQIVAWGYQAAAAIPMVDKGRALGVLALSFEQEQAFTAEDQTYALTLARQGAQALERARSYEAEQQARAAASAAARAAERTADRIARLQHVTAELAAALTTAQVAEVILGQASVALNAAALSVKLLSNDGLWLEDIVRVGDIPPAIWEAHERYPSSASTPLADSVRSGEALWLESRQAFIDRYPHLAEVYTAAQVEATCTFPLVLGGHILGGMAISFSTAVSFDSKEREFLLTLASQCAQALERARLYEAEQQARVELEQRVRERTAELERSNRELDQFAYVASHDLRSPLRGIEHLANFILEDAAGTLPDSSQRHLALMQGRIKRMETLLNDLLGYSRAGRHRYAPERLDVPALIRKAVELLAPPPEFVVEIVEPMPVLIGERVPLETVFRNLIDNAIKHHHRPEDGIIRIGISDRGDWVEFSVADNGPGIDPGFHERIFEIFQTLKPRDQVEGSGVGLTVVKKMVEMRGGTIWVESTPGVGTTFHFTWPKQPPVEANTAPEHTATHFSDEQLRIAG